MGNLVIGMVFVGAILNIIGLAVYGFYLPANIRVGLSVPQFLSTVTALVVALSVNRTPQNRVPHRPSAVGKGDGPGAGDLISSWHGVYLGDGTHGLYPIFRPPRLARA